MIPWILLLPKRRFSILTEDDDILPRYLSAPADAEISQHGNFSNLQHQDKYVCNAMLWQEGQFKVLSVIAVSSSASTQQLFITSNFSQSTPVSSVVSSPSSKWLWPLTRQLFVTHTRATASSDPKAAAPTKSLWSSQNICLSPRCLQILQPDWPLGLGSHQPAAGENQCQSCPWY